MKLSGVGWGGGVKFKMGMIVLKYVTSPNNYNAEFENLSSCVVPA